MVVIFIIRLSGTYCLERDTSPRTSWENLQDANQGIEESFQGLRPLPLPPFLEKNAKCSFHLQIQAYAPLSIGGALPSSYFKKPGCAPQFPLEGPLGRLALLELCVSLNLVGAPVSHLGVLMWRKESSLLLDGCCLPRGRSCSCHHGIYKTAGPD